MKKFVFLFEICLIIFLSLVIFSAVASADHGLGVNSITGVREAGEPAATQRVNGAQMSSRGIKIEDGRVVVENDRGGKGEIFSGGEPGGQSGACQEERGNSPTEGATCNVTCPPDSKISSNNSEQFVQVASHVNLFTRQYQDENVDLSVKSAGGYIKIYRIYINGKWQFEHEYNSLGVSTAQAGNIQKSGLTYRKGKDGLFHYKSFFIRPVGERYRWENKAGNYVLFSRKGRMLETGNGFGILARYKYENDRLVSIDDRSNSPIYHFHYGANDKVNRISDQHGRDVFYKWEAEKLLEVTDVLGNSLRYGYSSTAQLINKKDDAGRELLITYHAGGAVRDVLSRKGGGFSFSYKQIKEQNEYYAKVTSAMGNVMEYWFDTSGETKKIVENDHVIREDTWGDDQLTSSDELGSRTIKTYDLYGNLRKVEFADGSTIRHIYDEKNNLVSTKNEMGVITRYSYNAQGMVWKLWAAHGTDDEVVTEYQYDPKGNLITSTVAGEKENVVTRFIYDESDNLVKIIDPMGSERIFEYDYMGNVVKVTNPAGLSSIMVYDLKGRLLKTRYPDGQSLTSVYDAADRLVSETDVEGNTTHYSYDSQDNLVKIKDPLGGVSRYSFDNDNRLTKKIDEEGKYHVFFYVGGSDLINKVVDGNNNQINITYRSFDNCGHCPTTYSQKPVRIEFPTFIRQFTYDNRGRLKEKSDLLGTTFYTEKYLYDESASLII